MRVTHSAISIYMILVLLRWLGPWIGLEMSYGRWRWIARVTDPLINRVRQIIPNLGPVDFGPIATVFILWFVRVLLVSIFLDVAARSPVA
jgi:uncharacterized protein YggT (Ycf19 family)